MSDSSALPTYAAASELDRLARGTVIRPVDPPHPAVAVLAIPAGSTGPTRWQLSGMEGYLDSENLLRIAPTWQVVVEPPAQPDTVTVERVLRVTVDRREWAEHCDIHPDHVEADVATVLEQNLPDTLLAAEFWAGCGDSTVVTLLDPESAPTRWENGDWKTCSLHGGALTQDCDCTPAAGLGDLSAAAEVLWAVRDELPPVNAIDTRLAELPYHRTVVEFHDLARRIIAAYHDVKAEARA
jgi:hypothetical protein